MFLNCDYVFIIAGPELIQQGMQHDDNDDETHVAHLIAGPELIQQGMQLTTGLPCENAGFSNSAY